jgi:hypothetical protein
VTSSMVRPTWESHRAGPLIVSPPPARLTPPRPFGFDVKHPLGYGGGNQYPYRRPEDRPRQCFVTLAHSLITSGASGEYRPTVVASIVTQEMTVPIYGYRMCKPIFPLQRSPDECITTPKQRPTVEFSRYRTGVLRAALSPKASQRSTRIVGSHNVGVLVSCAQEQDQDQQLVLRPRGLLVGP